MKGIISLIEVKTVSLRTKIYQLKCYRVLSLQNSLGQALSKVLSMTVAAMNMLTYRNSTACLTTYQEKTL